MQLYTWDFLCVVIFFLHLLFHRCRFPTIDHMSQLVWWMDGRLSQQRLTKWDDEGVSRSHFRVLPSMFVKQHNGVYEFQLTCLFLSSRTWTHGWFKFPSQFSEKHSHIYAKMNDNHRFVVSNVGGFTFCHNCNLALTWVSWSKIFSFSFV